MCKERQRANYTMTFKGVDNFKGISSFFFNSGKLYDNVKAIFSNQSVKVPVEDGQIVI